MFQSASSFNSDISKWEVSSVTKMDAMFGDAVSFTQNLCGDAWVQSKASKTAMFKGSRGSISRTVCTSTTAHEHFTRRPLIERDLKIVRAPIRTPVSASTNKMICTKCGTFKKSGKVSCCAPGGAWYKSCGGAGNRNVDHRWFEGLAACKCKYKAKAMSIYPCAYKTVLRLCFRLCVLSNAYAHTHEQPQRRQSGWDVPHAARSRNPGK